ncbi:hypothetical protein BH11PSE5_BH11PSE5_23360 [soil metagenome]
MTGNNYTPKVGFIGLGDIGAPMAMRLHETGHEVAVWNRTTARTHPFAAQGFPVPHSASELATMCDIVCLCLSSAEAVADVVFGPDGIASASAAPRIIVDHSTISPKDTQALAHRLYTQTGTTWLDAPVSGGPPGARAGTLAIMVGGRREDFETAAPILESLAKRLTHVGDLGMGQLAKASNQIIGFITTAAIAEAFAFAEAAGLSAETLSEALAGGFADSTVLGEYRRASAAEEMGGLKGLIEAYMDLSRGYIRPDYAGKIDILHKDIGIAGAIAQANGTPIPLLHQVETLGRLLHYQRGAKA